LIHTGVLLISIIGGKIAKNLSDSLFIDVVVYITGLSLYVWMLLELNKYITFAKDQAFNKKFEQQITRSQPNNLNLPELNDLNQPEPNDLT
jgi:hypothetical protein